MSDKNPTPHPLPGVVRWWNAHGHAVESTLRWPAAHFTASAAIVVGLAVSWSVVRSQGEALRTGAQSRLRAKRHLPQTLADHLISVLEWNKHTGDKRDEKSLPPRAAKRTSWIVEYGWQSRRRRDDITQVHARYPRTFEPTNSKVDRVVEMVGLVLGGGWSAIVDPVKHWIVLTRSVKLPDRYEYIDCTKSANKIPIGIRGNGQPVIFDLRAESPHALISASTGRGKTTLLSVVIAHTAHHNGLVTVIDPKIAGFSKTFRDLHNVKVLTPRTGKMTEAIIELRDVMDRRYDEMDDGRTEKSFDRDIRMLVIDEMDTFTAMAAEEWREIKERGDSPTAPALRALREILYKGRAARVHCVIAAQHPDVSAVGGGNATSAQKDAFGYKVALGDPSPATIRKMWSDSARRPTVPDGPGRAVMMFNSELETIQFAYVDILDGREVRAIASVGTSRFDGGHFPTPTPVDTSKPDLEHMPTKSKAVLQLVRDVPGGPDDDDVGVGDPVGESPTPRARVHRVLPPAPGSPTTHDAVRRPVSCHGCANEWKTKAKYRSRLTCPRCGTSVKAPK